MKTILASILMAILIMSCKPNTETNIPVANEKAEISELNFIHTVFFWLKEDVTDDQRKLFESGMNNLGKVSTIGKYYIATPADTDREVIDNSYDYAWIVHFKDVVDQASYQSDSLHLEFIDKYNALWEKVMVYDSEVTEQSE
ncbi:MAG: Dabb family protein [Bacteroidales bacterium]|nr:Dabb family protein [Bacteroidales bacterium]